MKLGTMVLLAGVAADSKTLAITYFSSGVSRRVPTVWRACRVKGFLGSCARFGGVDGRGSNSTATTAAAAGGPRRYPGARGGRRGRADVGELHEHSGVQRHRVEVAVAGEGNALAVLGEVGIGFGVGGLSELGDLAGVVVQGKEIAGIGVDYEAPVFADAAGGWGSLAECGRQQPDLFGAKFAQATAVAIDGISVHGRDFLVGALFPLEQDAAAVVRPAYAGGLVADQGGTAHDVVDGEREFTRRPGLRNEQNDEGGQNR